MINVINSSDVTAEFYVNYLAAAIKLGFKLLIYLIQVNVC
jgi:hypothetical protein